MRQARTILQEAQRLIYGARAEKYGEPIDNHGCTSDMFRAYVKRKYGVDVPFDPEDTCVFNILQKVSREANVHQRDNLIDGAGYFGNIEKIVDERARRS